MIKNILLTGCCAFLLGVGCIVAAPVSRDAGISTEAALRASTQQLLDAIAAGDMATWDRLLDPAVIQVDENDVVRRKPAILAELKPLPAGLEGHLKIDDFQMVELGNLAVVTHEDDEYLNYHGQIILSRFRITDTWHKTPEGWRMLGSQVLAVLKDPPTISLNAHTLCGYGGRYAMTDEITVTIHCDKNSLIVERAGHPPRQFLPELKDVFFERGQPRTRRIFLRGETQQITGFVDRREARDVAWTRIG
jgi:hypothetical protein